MTWMLVTGVGLLAFVIGIVVTVRAVPFMLARMSERQLDELGERVERIKYGRAG